MDRHQLRALKVGDRVRWERPDSSDRTEGEVVAKAHGQARIRWADGQEEWLGWRSEVDRARGRNIALVEPDL